MFMKLFFVLLTLIFSSFSATATPPTQLPKNVQLIIPYGPGGVADVQFKDLSRWLNKKGISLTALYKPGGNSTVAALDFLSSPKDGSVLMINSTSNSWLAESRLNRPVIDPITTTGGNANALITFPGSKYENYDEFIKSLKSGDKDIKIGWHAVANLINLNQLAEKTGSPKPLFVPYKTSTDSSKDVSGKHIPLALVPMTTALPLVEAGKVKIVFGFSAGRSGLPPGVLDLRTKMPSWKHDELFFIGLPPDVDNRIYTAWADLLREYLSEQETDEAYTKAYFGKDVGDRNYVKETIRNQSNLIKKYNIEIK
jgi:tripartite-type tricarboxylate transporter receptor subunit TctC